MKRRGRTAGRREKEEALKEEQEIITHVMLREAPFRKPNDSRRS
jgi:hypothetical protein